MIGSRVLSFTTPGLTDEARRSLSPRSPTFLKLTSRVRGKNLSTLEWKRDLRASSERPGVVKDNTREPIRLFLS